MGRRWWPWLQKPLHLVEATCWGEVGPLNQPSQGLCAFRVPAPGLRARPTCAARPWHGPGWEKLSSPWLGPHQCCPVSLS